MHLVRRCNLPRAPPVRRSSWRRPSRSACSSTPTGPTCTAAGASRGSSRVGATTAAGSLCMCVLCCACCAVHALNSCGPRSLSTHTHAPPPPPPPPPRPRPHRHTHHRHHHHHGTATRTTAATTHTHAPHPHPPRMYFGGPPYSVVCPWMATGGLIFTSILMLWNINGGGLGPLLCFVHRIILDSCVETGRLIVTSILMLWSSSGGQRGCSAWCVASSSPPPLLAFIQPFTFTIPSLSPFNPFLHGG
jgi:hypothetical protein